MIQKFEMPLPPTLNDQIRMARSHWAASAKSKKQHTQEAAWAARNLEPIQGERYWFYFIWRLKNFGRDADNITAATKFILDGLQEAGIIASDNLKHIPGPWVHSFDRGKDTVEIWLSDQPIVQIDFLDFHR